MPRYSDLTGLERNPGIDISNEQPELGTTSLKPVLGRRWRVARFSKQNERYLDENVIYLER